MEADLRIPRNPNALRIADINRRDMDNCGNPCTRTRQITAEDAPSVYTHTPRRRRRFGGAPAWEASGRM